MLLTLVASHASVVRNQERCSRTCRGGVMALHVIVGKGAVGTTTAQELAARGHRVRVLSRSGGTSTGAVEHRKVDATDADALTAATRGAAALYNAVNPAYHRWA